MLTFHMSIFTDVTFPAINARAIPPDIKMYDLGLPYKLKCSSWISQKKNPVKIAFEI